MNNPYEGLHREFARAGARVMLSSGQACVMYGIAAFSKDGDWIIEESEESCRVVLSVLEKNNASYRLGAPLDIRFLSQGWTSHFEYQSEDIRMRVDFCSRPPRIQSLDALWKNMINKKGIAIVDAESLILLKQTRRIRDYSVIGALAETLGFNANVPEIALAFLQDYDLLKKAVERWPDQARKSDRDAVRLIVSGGSRRDVIIAIAVEQDLLIQKDQARIDSMVDSSKDFSSKFFLHRKKWKECGSPLSQQHAELVSLAEQYLQPL
ncbi:MAG: hypothetical protein JW768_01740 [Chitinispirillaceae bacterium]|nr:hypothetical protein [Chitinispirillaceae bacterium]